MNFELRSSTYGLITFQSEIPSSLAKSVIPGSLIHYAEGVFGSILLQELTAGRLTIWYNTYAVKDDLALDFEAHLPVLQAQVCIRNDAQYEIKGLNWVELKQGQCNICYLPALKGTTYLEHGSEYITFDICFSIEYLHELASLFPSLEDFITRAIHSKPALLFKRNQWITTAMLEIIDQLLHCSFEGELRQYYFVHKVQEFLLLVLSNPPAAYSGLSQAALDSVYHAKYIIETRFAEHIILQEIARQVGLNETKLKYAFKLVFGLGMFEFLLKTRMKKAKALLLESDKPIKAIAKLTGYATRQGFITAFKNYYDDTPSSFRKNM